MCKGPCPAGSAAALYIAAHLSVGGDYTAPTQVNSGEILQLNIDHNGSIIGPPTSVCGAGTLNRPSTPAFCKHGSLFVSSFDGGEEQVRSLFRWDRKNNSMNQIRVCSGDSNPVSVWGVGVVKDEVYVTDHFRSRLLMFNCKDLCNGGSAVDGAGNTFVRARVLGCSEGAAMQQPNFVLPL